jgi:hypothetical protein
MLVDSRLHLVGVAPRQHGRMAETSLLVEKGTDGAKDFLLIIYSARLIFIVVNLRIADARERAPRATQYTLHRRHIACA